MKPYLLVNGNFVRTNGMDMPNLALASYLAERGAEVHLVAHKAEPELANHPQINFHRVPKTAGSYLLAAPALDRAGRRWAEKIAARGGCVIVNGGNCRWADVNWVHYVHASFQPPRAGGALRVLKNEYAHKTFLKRERESLTQARLVITNSERTRRDVVERLHIPAERVRTIYYGIDADRFRPASADERASAREKLGWSSVRPVVAFIGALGDRRKGFDILFAAWQKLCEDKSWEADLAVVGTGAELPAWKARAAQAGLPSRIRFLGFRKDVQTILAASDALVAPTRYEAYGQGVHEALCCGLPALVSQAAGVAERYTSEMRELLIINPEDVDELAQRLRDWQKHAVQYSRHATSLSQTLRAHTWQHMAAQIAELLESTKGNLSLHVDSGN
jgi:glycosyltransferase involved in cell wall biosynthesis